MKAIIPTGGMGTRMQPMSFYVNKHFLPLANKPLLFYPIETVASAGIKDVLITYNPGGLDFVKRHLGDGSAWGLKFTYVKQKNPRGGLADIVRVCEKELKGDLFLLHLGDNIFTEGIKEQVKYFVDNKPNGLVTMVKFKDNTRLGVPVFDKKGRLIDYLEKPKKPPNEFAIPGLYFFDSNVFKCFSGKDKITPSERGELEIRSPYMWLIEHGYKVDVVEYKGRWMDPGKFDDWIDSNQFLLDKVLEPAIESKIEEGSNIKGRVYIGKNCVIRNSEIRGPVSIKDNVSIINSYVGPYTSIDTGCVIEKSRVENCVLMNDVRIYKVKRQIDNSLIGPEASISSTNGRHSCLEFFIGEKATIRL
ncbi:glucose-1-phosphate thymidylyltransferase [Patescibacteria group bacterium]